MTGGCDVIKLLKKGSERAEMENVVSVRRPNDIYLGAFQYSFKIGEYVQIFQSDDGLNMYIKPVKDKGIHTYKIQASDSDRAKDKPRIRPGSIIKYLGLKYGRYAAEWDKDKGYLIVYL